MSRRALVRLAGQGVGELAETADGYVFTYAPEWVSRIGSQSVSLNLAVRAEPYVSKNLHPCFANLLPEGWLLELSVAKLKIPADDLFGLLLAVCHDCVGAVEIVPADSEGA